VRRAVAAGLAAAAAALGPRAAAAQLVQGRVVTATAAKPIAGVPVRLLRVTPADTAPLPADTTPVASHQTTADGFFTLLAPDTGTYRARIGDAFVGPVLHLARADTLAAAEYRLAGEAIRALFESEVEKQARARPGSLGRNLRYPSELQAAGVQGRVIVQFVVDTNGRAEMGTLRVLSASHDGFLPAVRTAVLLTEFSPAEVRGRKVRQLVQQPFTFALGGEWTIPRSRSPFGGAPAPGLTWPPSLTPD
jgi:TonB family protein